MKVTVEYHDRVEAITALQSLAYVEFIEEFQRFLATAQGPLTRAEIMDKFCALRDLYKV